jgi:uncharacterized membrane protein YfhO
MEATGLGTTSRTSYLLDYNAVDTVLDTVSESDSDFYRVDKVSGIRSKNDGAWHNYRSIATFSSTSNAGMSELFGLLGIESSTNAYGCEGSTMVTNSIFSVKYIISNQHLEQSSLQSYYAGYDGEFIYKNQYTLSPGFLLPSDFDEVWQPSSVSNGIENQNSFIKAATGINSVFTLTCEFTTETDVFVEPVKNGHMYLCISNPNLDTLNVSINGTPTSYSGLKNGNHTIDIGYVTTSDSIEIYSDSALSMSVYTLESDRFISAYTSLSAGMLNVTSYSDTKLSGTVNAASDGIFVFSIPYDKGWHVYVDGKRVETSALKDALLSINLSAGEHTIKLKYTPVNLIKGCIITLLCIIILVMVCLSDRFIASGRIDFNSLPVLLREYISKDDVLFNNQNFVIDTQAHINELSDEYILSENMNDYQTDFDAPDKDEL